MKVGNVKVFFKYEKVEVDEQVPVMEGSKVKREKGKKVFTLTGNKKLVRVVEGKTEAIAINTDTGEEITRREVKLRHGDTPSNKLAY